MRRILWLPVLLLITSSCGKDKDDQDPNARWFSSPTKVVEGIMHAYETRDVDLYASFLSDDFRYYFEPQGADSADVLGWGKEEEVVATGNLFRTQDVESLAYSLEFGKAKSATGAGREDWMIVPVSGGEMVVAVHDKEPMEVVLNRQEIVLRPLGGGNASRKWEVIEWHDYPALDAGADH